MTIELLIVVIRPVPVAKCTPLPICSNRHALVGAPPGDCPRPSAIDVATITTTIVTNRYRLIRLPPELSDYKLRNSGTQELRS